MHGQPADPVVRVGLRRQAGQSEARLTHISTAGDENRDTRRRAATMEIVANALVYVGGYVFLVFMAVCLATGACDARTRRRRDAMIRFVG